MQVPAEVRSHWISWKCSCTPLLLMYDTCRMITLLLKKGKCPHDPCSRDSLTPLADSAIMIQAQQNFMSCSYCRLRWVELLAGGVEKSFCICVALLVNE